MILARPAAQTGRIWALQRGLAGVRPADFAALGDDDSPLVNDVDAGDETTSFLWFLTPPLVDGTNGGTTTVNDQGGYRNEGGTAGSFTQGYGWSAVRADGSIAEQTGTISIGSGSTATVSGAGAIASGEAFGTAALVRQALASVAAAGGIASGEAFGTAVLARQALAAVAGAGGIASGETFGSAAVSAGGVYSVGGAGGIASGEAFGLPVLTRTGGSMASISAAGGIASGEAFGTASLVRFGSAQVSAAGGIPSTTAFGLAVLTGNGFPPAQFVDPAVLGPRAVARPRIGTTYRVRRSTIEPTKIKG